MPSPTHYPRLSVRLYTPDHFTVSYNTPQRSTGIGKNHFELSFNQGTKDSNDMCEIFNVYYILIQFRLSSYGNFLNNERWKYCDKMLQQNSVSSPA